GRITQEHSHRPMKACTGVSYNTDLCADFRLWRRNGSGKTLLETAAAGEKIEDGLRHDSIPGEWKQSPFVHKLVKRVHTTDLLENRWARRKSSACSQSNRTRKLLRLRPCGSQHPVFDKYAPSASAQCGGLVLESNRSHC